MVLVVVVDLGGGVVVEGLMEAGCVRPVHLLECCDFGLECVGLAAGSGARVV